MTQQFFLGDATSTSGTAEPKARSPCLGEFSPDYCCTSPQVMAYTRSSYGICLGEFSPDYHCTSPQDFERAHYRAAGVLPYKLGERGMCVLVGVEPRKGTSVQHAVAFWLLPRVELIGVESRKGNALARNRLGRDYDGHRSKVGIVAYE